MKIKMKAKIDLVGSVFWKVENVINYSVFFYFYLNRDFLTLDDQTFFFFLEHQFLNFKFLIFFLRPI